MLLLGSDHRRSEARTELRQIGSHFDLLDAIGRVQMALYGGDRHHSLVRRAQLGFSFLGRHRTRLQEQDAGDDLQAVGDPVLHFAQQRLLLLQQLFGVLQQPLLLLLDHSAFSNVLDRQQDHAAPAGFVPNRKRVELDRAPA